MVHNCIMSTYTYQYEDASVEVTERIFADIIVDYEVGEDVPGDYYEPGERGEVEIIDVDFTSIYGDNWEKTYEELRDSGWLWFLVRTKAWKNMCNNLDETDLYVHARTNYCDWEED